MPMGCPSQPMFVPSPRPTCHAYPTPVCMYHSGSGSRRAARSLEPEPLQTLFHFVFIFFPVDMFAVGVHVIYTYIIAMGM